MKDETIIFGEKTQNEYEYKEKNQKKHITLVTEKRKEWLKKMLQVEWEKH